MCIVLDFTMGSIPILPIAFFEKLNATGEINEHRKGVAISNMSGKALASILFPLPPLEEQKRIVAKVDQLMALCDQLEEKQNNRTETHISLIHAAHQQLTNASEQADMLPAWERIRDNFDHLYTTVESIKALRQVILQLAVQGRLVGQVCRMSQRLRSGALKSAKYFWQGGISEHQLHRIMLMNLYIFFQEVGL